MYSLTSNSERIASWIAAKKTHLDSVAIEILQSKNLDELSSMFARQASHDSAILDMYIGFSNDVGIFGDGEAPEGWRATQRHFYVQAILSITELKKSF